MTNVISGSYAIHTAPLPELKNLNHGFSSGMEAIVPDTKFSGEDSFKISTEAKHLNRASKLEKELDNIFGLPKNLSKKEQEEEKRILKEIDAIFEKNGLNGLNEKDRKTEEKILKKIEELFKDEKLSKDEEEQLEKLEKRLDGLYAKYDQKELGKEDEKKLEELFSKLDSLYGLKEPTKEELLRAEKIYQELDGLTASENF